MNDENDPRNSEDGGPEGPNPWIKSLMIWGGVFVALLLAVSVFSSGNQPTGEEID